MIKNILFDMGNVVIRFDRGLIMDHAGVTDPADRALLLREVFLSLEWARMDRGTVTDEEAVEIVCRRVPERLHDAVRKIITFWDRPIVEIPGVYELIEELKENGYKIYLLSNASTRQPEYWQRVPAAKFFDGTLVSAFHKLIKPMPEIYELMLKTFSLKAEECFFIDDSAYNVDAASLCGIQGAVFFEDMTRLRGELRAAGVWVKA